LCTADIAQEVAGKPLAGDGGQQFLLAPHRLLEAGQAALPCDPQHAHQST
jgi:hypothetical protein